MPRFQKTWIHHRTTLMICTRYAINLLCVVFFKDLNMDDDTVTSTSQFIREEVIFTPAAGRVYSHKHSS